MDSVLVSVIIPTYNGAAFVDEALSSVCAQSLGDLEIIAVDDGSIDGTLDIVARCRDPRLRVIRNTTHLGLAGNWNYGVELSKGEYVMILHQDDRLAPRMLEKQVDSLSKVTGSGIAYAAYRLINANGEMIHVVRPFPDDHVWSGEQEFGFLIRKCYIQCPTVVARRSCYEELGLFNPRLVYALDWEMWLRMASHGYSVVYQAEPLADWRIHDRSTTRSLEREDDVQIIDQLAALDFVFDNVPEEHASLQGLRKRASYELIKQALLRAIDAKRHNYPPGVRRNLRAAKLAYAHGGDMGFFPFVLRDSLRFIKKSFQERI